MRQRSRIGNGRLIRVDPTRPVPRSRDETPTPDADTTIVPRLLRTLVLLSLLTALFATDAFAYKVARTPAPPAGTVGVPYSFTFGTEGGTAPHTLTIQSGALPPGLTLATSGAVSGTPTTAGSWNFFVEAVDANGARTQVPFTIGVAAKLTITTGGLPGSTRGVPYGVALTASGGVVDSWSVSAGSLPPGIGLGADGVVSGTPTAEGTWTFTVKAIDDSRSDTKTLTLQVVEPLAISVSAMPPAVVGQPFATKLSVSGGIGTYSFRLASGSMPSGLALDPATGVVSGTPRVAGRFGLQLAVDASGGGQAVQIVPLTIAARLGFVTGALPKAKVGRSYSTRIVVRGGVGPIALTSTSVFPAGLRLDGDTGRLAGKPLRAGTYRVTVRALDSFGGSTIKRFTLVVGR